ncbi:head completion/stabilization protein [uncultured Kiloniella sp.]|uniref:head completion/stabilization protein n=1 Tax=uncultured Kiloniella sp. TaxID=1133091 RepID=UPI00261DF5F7|nr:head completion/stabilization protein [uncultured Kiloniella sp.]
MSFVPNNHNTPATDETVSNTGFYPDLSLDEFKKSMSVGNDNDVTRLTAIVTEAMIEINRSLMSWRDGLLQYASLDLVPAIMYGETSEKVFLYKTAVFNRARALLVETRKDYDSTKSGRDKADQIELPADDYYRASTEALNRLIDRPRSTIELI